MIFVMYADSKPDVRVWYCGECERVALFVAGKPAPPHLCAATMGEAPGPPGSKRP